MSCSSGLLFTSSFYDSGTKIHTFEKCSRNAKRQRGARFRTSHSFFKKKDWTGEDGGTLEADVNLAADEMGSKVRHTHTHR